MVAFIALLVVAVCMIGEAMVSRRNEQWLRARGALEGAGDVYGIMTVAYPMCFLAMGIESVVDGGPSGRSLVAGATIFTMAKALKYWAMASLGPRWTFRVMVLPGAPLVTSGPYRWIRHPNYVAVAGELVGAALALQAPASGIAGTSFFVGLMWRRIQVEERALGLR